MSRQTPSTPLIPFDSLVHWLAACHLSTLTGMRLPGRYATFLEFRLTFDQPPELNHSYVLQGKVQHKSEATRTLVNEVKMALLDPESHLPVEPRHEGVSKVSTGVRPLARDLIASGETKVLVQDPPPAMPTMAALAREAVDPQLKDKVVLITGASRGLGETMAKLFALHEAKVVVNYWRGKDDAERVVQEIEQCGQEALAFGADVTDPAQVKAMVNAACERFGTIHVLVNNAVRDFQAIPFSELTWPDVQQDLDVVLQGAFHCCQAVLPLMVKNKQGKIINISTLAAENPVPHQAKYIMAKSALAGLTRSLAVEYAAHRIQVNTVVPSFMETDLTQSVPSPTRDAMKEASPLKRHATVVDAAKAVVYAASSWGSFTTGQKIMVTGGQPPFL